MDSESLITLQVLQRRHENRVVDITDESVAYKQKNSRNIFIIFIKNYIRTEGNPLINCCSSSSIVI
jgi:hypothetical protein